MIHDADAPGRLLSSAPDHHPAIDLAISAPIPNLCAKPRFYTLFSRIGIQASHNSLRAFRSAQTRYLRSLIPHDPLCSPIFRLPIDTSCIARLTASHTAVPSCFAGRYQAFRQAAKLPRRGLLRPALPHCISFARGLPGRVSPRHVLFSTSLSCPPSPRAFQLLLVKKTNRKQGDCFVCSAFFYAADSRPF